MRSLFCAVLYFHIVRVSLVHGRHFKLFFNTWVERHGNASVMIPGAPHGLHDGI